ncbi:thioesterase II family protein [Actinoplanes sp. CA-051413]|uniref:thioesterase II family protein n=1 Tax=Actinoplanes sp. CA-051413 TaxID=3239899 RepID=UPI003D985B90
MTAPATRFGRYLSGEPRGDDVLRLFCFHHAGGAASTFSGWRGALGEHVSVLPVQLPGRENRIREPRIRDMPALVAELDRHLGPLLDRPYAFYGHSMGALVAYHLARLRQTTGRSLPQRLLVGAFPAPHRPAATVPATDQPDDVLVRWMRDIGGVSPELLNYPEWLRAVAALVRDDLALCRGGLTEAWRPLSCPVDVFHAADDPLVSAADARAWEQHTSRGCTVHGMAGGHFFHRDSAPALHSTLTAVLTPVPAGTPAAGSSGLVTAL